MTRAEKAERVRKILDELYPVPPIPLALPDATKAPPSASVSPQAPFSFR